MVSVQLLSNQTLNTNQLTPCNQANLFWKFEIDLPCELLHERRIVPDEGKAEAESHWVDQSDNLYKILTSWWDWWEAISIPPNRRQVFKPSLVCLARSSGWFLGDVFSGSGNWPHQLDSWSTNRVQQRTRQHPGRVQRHYRYTSITDPRGCQRRAPGSNLSISCSSWGKMAKIIGWYPNLWGWCPCLGNLGFATDIGTFINYFLPESYSPCSLSSVS